MDIVRDYLNLIKKEFYAGERAFYQQRLFLIKGITYPARWLDKRGVFLPEEDYGIKKHGNTHTVRSFGSYVLDSVQRHIEH